MPKKRYLVPRAKPACGPGNEFVASRPWEPTAMSSMFADVQLVPIAHIRQVNHSYIDDTSPEKVDLVSGG